MDDLLTKWMNLSDKLLLTQINLVKKLLKFFANLVPVLIGYTVMSYIFLSVYDTYGLERTLIILLVGVFWYGLRQRGIPLKKKDE